MRLPLVEEISREIPFERLVSRLVGHAHSLWLDSADPHPERGRYSYFSTDPTQFFRVDSVSLGESPFSQVDSLLRRVPLESVPHLPPFQGGFAGLFGYDLGHAFERLPRTRFDEFRVPVLALGLYDWVLAHDHLQDRTWLISTGVTVDREPSEARAAERLAWVRSQLQNEKPSNPFPGSTLALSQLVPQFPLFAGASVSSNFSRAAYLDAVRRAVEYVHAGDCFQVNLAQRLLAPLREEPWELYLRLRQKNPAPFAGYLDLGDFAVLSASPERFLRVEKGEIETRPIKGTRPRGATLEEDEQLKRQLQQSPKDRSENVMIVDLLRNDLGRVSTYGSVQVPRVCEVESYRFVHHLVSEVRGRLKPGKELLDLLSASFPGGSVTGAPKVRAMEIIAELEPTARGPYCGCLGYLGFNGSMDTNILIRTFTAGKGWLQFPVGGGIVAESEPDREYEETLHKAQGLLRALGEN
jgi:para-aminobenzoate synthetase component 1